MGAKAALANEVLYAEDFYEWTVRTAQMIREGRFDELAVDSLAEEIEDLGKRDLREVRSRLVILIAHLLKWQHQPNLRSSLWKLSVREQRMELDSIFSQSRSLYNKAAASLGDIYRRAAGNAEVETGLPADTFPAECPFNFQMLLRDDFWPE